MLAGSRRGTRTEKRVQFARKEGAKETRMDRILPPPSVLDRRCRRAKCVKEKLGRFLGLTARFAVCSAAAGFGTYVRACVLLEASSRSTTIYDINTVP